MAASTWPHWQHQFLHTAGLPVTGYTTYFLSEWARLEASRCDRNPVITSKREPGSTRCKRLPNGKYARNYTSRQSAANAFADQLNLTDYPHLRKALASGSPWTYKPASGVALELQKWGSESFHREYVRREDVTPAGSGSDALVTPKASKNVSGAWTRLMRTLAVEGHKTIVELRKSTAAMNRIERRLRRA